MTYDVAHLRHRFNEFHVVISLRHIQMDVASTYDNIGIVYMRLGNFQKALEYHEKALEIRINHLEYIM